MYSFLKYSNINLHIPSLSFLDNGYAFRFLSTNPSFVSIVWSYNFLVSILSLVFLPKTWIYLWNFFGTSFFTSSSSTWLPPLLSKMKVVDLTYFYVPFYSYFPFDLFSIFLILELRVRVRVTRSCCHTAGHIRWHGHKLWDT